MTGVVSPYIKTRLKSMVAALTPLTSNTQRNLYCVGFYSQRLLSEIESHWFRIYQPEEIPCFLWGFVGELRDAAESLSDELTADDAKQIAAGLGLYAERALHNFFENHWIGATHSDIVDFQNDCDHETLPRSWWGEHSPLIFPEWSEFCRQIESFIQNVDPELALLAQIGRLVVQIQHLPQNDPELNERHGTRYPIPALLTRLTHLRELDPRFADIRVDFPMGNSPIIGVSRESYIRNQVMTFHDCFSRILMNPPSARLHVELTNAPIPALAHCETSCSQLDVNSVPESSQEPACQIDAPGSTVQIREERPTVALDGRVDHEESPDATNVAAAENAADSDGTADSDDHEPVARKLLAVQRRLISIDPREQQRAAELLRDLLTPSNRLPTTEIHDVAGLLIDMLRKESDVEAAQAAIAALSVCHEVLFRFASEIMELLQSQQHVALFRELCGILGKLRPPAIATVEQLLWTVLDFDEPELKCAAAEALNEIDPDATALRGILDNDQQRLELIETLNSLEERCETLRCALALRPIKSSNFDEKRIKRRIDNKVRRILLLEAVPVHVVETFTLIQKRNIVFCKWNKSYPELEYKEILARWRRTYGERTAVKESYVNSGDLVRHGILDAKRRLPCLNRNAESTSPG